MAYLWQRWMVQEFRAAGLEVIVVEGWENRGRPASTGDYHPDQGVTNHHTGTQTSAASPGSTLKTLIEGRPDLPGPLAPWSVRWDGVVVIIAAGRCNHAGEVGKPYKFAAMGADGNAIFMGDEVDTNGTQDLPEAQRHAIAVTNAVYLRHFDHEDELERVHRHADISGTGKWDIGNLTTPELRADAADALEELDMPTLEQIAAAVWQHDLNPIGKDTPPINAGRMLVEVHNRAGDVKDLAGQLVDAEPGLDKAAVERALRKVLRQQAAAGETP